MRHIFIAATLFVAFAAPACAFDLQGHRGTRGLMPENTLPAFEKALTIGVTTIETDMAMTKDGVIVLAHDPYLSADLTRDATGLFLVRNGPPIRTLTYAETQTYDVGRRNPAAKVAAQWPEQASVDGTRIPRLADLFALVQRIAPNTRFNIETKLSPLLPAETADPETFVATFLAEVRKANVASRVTLQSFDWRTLRVSKLRAADIATSCLTIDTPTASTLRPVEGRPSPWLGGLDPAQYSGSVPRLVQAAGCSTWSPFWRNIDAANVKEAQGLGLKVLPWTINKPEDMSDVIALGVDGLITDYPDRAHKVLAQKGIAFTR
jgi:glycerophosphoryl diester phosphodiesterase